MGEWSDGWWGDLILNYLQVGHEEEEDEERDPRVVKLLL